MQTSLFIAKFLGPMLVVPGLIGLANPAHLKAVGEEFINSRALLFLAGVLAFLVGLALINTHNVWVGGWPVIITVFGWIALAAGIVRMGFPGLITSMGQTMLANEGLLRILGLVQVALGAYLTWQAYG